MIHRAVGEVDSGEVVMSRSTLNVCHGVESTTERLHEMAERMWIDLLTHPEWLER